MGTYLVRRTMLLVVTVLGVSIIIFALMRVVPGNIADILFENSGYIDAQQKAKIEAELGLDKPLPEQYFKWIGGLFEGDLGYSYMSERPAISEIAPRLPVTLKLAALTLFFTIAFGIPLGVWSAVKQNGLVDNTLRVVTLSALSLPSFWCGLLVLMFAVHVFGTIPIYADQPSSLWHELRLLSIPALVVGFRSSALIVRLTRSSMLEVLRQDYIRTARAKGASEKLINYHHALKNAVLPVITLLGIEAAQLIGGLVVIETVFNIPGLGRYLVDAIKWRDYPIVQNLVLFSAFAVVIMNFIVDMLYAVIDPRIKYSD
ncbi:MAG TPA: ABC transporter permease [Burkholderiales bacterium]|nr:ABC transporter permease [Burkholderiales bacterium]